MLKVRLETEDPKTVPDRVAERIIGKGAGINVDGVEIREREDVVRHIQQQYKDWMPMAVKELKRLGMI
jgi:hypothetical protein